jgi:hypothetical protein
LYADRRQVFDETIAIAEITFFSLSRNRAYVNGVIGAFIIALLTAGARAVVQQDDTILIFKQCVFLTRVNAWSMFAMVAQMWHKELFNIWIISCVVCVDSAPENSKGDFIFRLAGNLTGKTANTPAYVDQHGISFFLFCHYFI